MKEKVMPPTKVPSEFAMFYDPAPAEGSHLSFHPFGGQLSAAKQQIHQMLIEKGFVHYNSMADDVLKFMLAFDQFPRSIKDQIPEQDFALANGLITEEITEFLVAFDKCKSGNQSYENLTEMLDGAIDLCYVVIWAMLKFRLPFDKGWAEVQRSNMAKLNPDGSYEKNPETGKVRKPATWTPPDLFSIVLAALDQATYKGNMRVD
jgi:hypothetical protein